ncbi:unnamed protein product [Rhodiola kirilowii]
MTQQAAPQPAQSFYQPPHQQYNQNAPTMGQYQQKGPNQYQPISSNHQGPNKSLEDMIKQLSGTVQQLSTNVHQNQVETKEELSDLKKHMSQLATSMSALINEPGRLPSQTVQNPKENVNVVALSSGKKLVNKPTEQDEDKSPRLPGEEQVRPEALVTLEQDKEEDVTEEEGNTSKDYRPGPVPAASLVPESEEHRPRPVPRTKTSRSASRFHFQYQPVYQNNMSWTRMCSNYSAKSKSTSPS